MQKNRAIVRLTHNEDLENDNATICEGSETSSHANNDTDREKSDDMLTRDKVICEGNSVMTYKDNTDSICGDTNEMMYKNSDKTIPEDSAAIFKKKLCHCLCDK